MLRINAMKLLNGISLNFDLALGESVVIRGKNGSGKSLLLKSMARLIPASFESFTFFDRDIRSFPLVQLRSEILYVSATPTSMNQGPVEDFFRAAHQLHIYRDHTVTFPWKDYLNKWHIHERNFQNLSSGQRQMLSILRALTLRAKVLLLDEPTANLDQEKTLEIEELIKDWQRNTNGSVVLISHSIEQTKRLGFKIVPFEALTHNIS